MKALLAVFIGGGLGSMLRYGISVWLLRFSAGFPWGTLLANLLSCAVLAWGFLFFSKNNSLGEEYRLLVLVGFCGGFSTFSTFSHETLQLLRQGQAGMAFLYIGLSVCLCVGLIWGIYRWAN